MPSLPIVCLGAALVSQIPPLVHRDTLSGLDNPSRIAVTSAEILVSDSRAERIVRFDLAGNELGAWSEPAGPVGIAAALDGRLFVSRRDDGRVGIYDSSFVLQGFLGEGAVAFAQPTALAADPVSGRIYVVDSGADRVYAFDSAGALVLMFGIRGSGFGQFKYPSAIALDAVNNRILIADQDNFRVQAFDASGIFLSSFGYRIKYLRDGSREGWFQRTAGLAVDDAGRIYVADAHMGTVRVFDPLGAEVGKVVEYGSAPGQLQTPCDVVIDSLGRVLVANSNVGTVEMYDAVSSVLAAASATYFEGTNESLTDRLDPRAFIKRKLPRGLRRVISADGGGSAAFAGGWDPPHMPTDTPCARCHDVDGQPGGHEGTVAGQTNLCLSCHTGGGQALPAALRAADRMSVGGPPPATGGRSHAWGVSAVNGAVGSVGPPSGSEMARYTVNGVIKCATCHNQHNSSAGAPYLRVNNGPGALCLQCHTDHVGHTPHGSWTPTCNECHDMHNPRSENIALVRTSVYNRTLGVTNPVAFEARSGPKSFADGDGVYDGLCEVCHTATAHHRHDGTGTTHNPGQNCIQCHPHENGFLPTGGSCTGCHAVAQDNGDGIPVGGRRAVVGEFPAADAHAHYGAALDDAACVVCHDQATHMDGYVDLFGPDGGTLRFRRPEDLASDPDVSDFCAGCHDADGATRMATPFDPFGSGHAPPDVASRLAGSLQWDELYGDFCFGSEGTLRGVNSHHDISDADQAFSGAKIECLNCHGVHSAGATQPLSDPFNNPTPWTGSTTEFCLRCHGGGSGPLDPGFPAGVAGPVVDVSDPRWATLGFDWNVILGGACLSGGCSSLRGIDSCDYVEGPWYVDYSWTHSAHGPDSKRAWNGYSGAPAAELDCMVCHDPHGSATPSNPAGNPYMIRDVVDGTPFVDDGTRPAGFNGPPWNTFGVSRPVAVPVSGPDVGWGASTGLCSACHADWLAAYDFHGFCNSCQTCHGHGQAWGEADWVGFVNDTPCPVPTSAPASSTESSLRRKPAKSPRVDLPPLHQAAPEAKGK